jgi:putative transposase
VDALEAALADARPEIFNTDQGAQFTAMAFTSRLEKSGVAISMDGRGRALDNVFVERLWRTVKYEEVYLREYVDGWKAEESLGDYFDFYCHERPHQALGYRTPAEVYRAGRSEKSVRAQISVETDSEQTNINRNTTLKQPRGRARPLERVSRATT